VRGYSLVLPADFDEVAWLIETEGWFAGVTIEAGTDRYRPEFYDPVRLAQTIADEVRRSGIAVVENIIVVPAVTLDAIEASVGRLADEDFASRRALTT
jgi:hypothetical protein